MRETKFRGLRTDGKGWEYGDYHFSHSSSVHLITRGDGWRPTYNSPDKGEETLFFEIDFNTLGQFTGLKDKNGKEIYEGDIVTAWSAGYKGNFQIKWRQEGAPCWLLFPAWQNREFWHIHASEYKKGKKFISVDGTVWTCDIDAFVDDGIEVIGNIHEKPELL